MVYCFPSLTHQGGGNKSEAAKRPSGNALHLCARKQHVETVTAYGYSLSCSLTSPPGADCSALPIVYTFCYHKDK